MPVTEGVVEAVNFQVEDLAVGSESSILLRHLMFYDSSIQLITDWNDYEMVCTVLSIPLGKPKMLKYKILNSLCSRLQAERMISHAVKSGPRAEQTSKKGTMAFRLEKMCSHMGVTLENMSDLNVVNESSDICSAILQQLGVAIQEKQVHASSSSTVPLLSVGSSSSSSSGAGGRASAPSATSPGPYTSKQYCSLVDINESLYKDYWLRRRMLLQRLDVTLESLFLRSEGQSLESDSGKKNSDIVTVILAQREHLSEYPVAYSLGDALQATTALLEEFTKPNASNPYHIGNKGVETAGRNVGNTDTKRNNIVKSIIIGKVPDRGGRVDGRPKSSAYKPPFNASNSHSGYGSQGSNNGRKNNSTGNNKVGNNKKQKQG